MISRLFKYAFYTSSLTGSAYLAYDIYKNDGVNSNGVIRFGRATVAVRHKFFLIKN